jgi:hypothetical protein
MMLSDPVFQDLYGSSWESSGRGAFLRTEVSGLIVDGSNVAL